MSQIKPDPEFVPRNYQIQDMEGRVITIEDRTGSQKIAFVANRSISPLQNTSSLAGRVESI